MDSDYRILTWNVIIIISNLTKIDAIKKFDKIFNKYLGLLNNDYMVTATKLLGDENSELADKSKFKVSDLSLFQRNVDLEKYNLKS